MQNLIHGDLTHKIFFSWCTQFDVPSNENRHDTNWSLFVDPCWNFLWPDLLTLALVGFYAGLNLIAWFMIFCFVRETKQLTLEELDRK